jgi:hypothetical protein
MCKSTRNTGGNLVATLDLDPVAKVHFAPVCTGFIWIDQDTHA